MILFLGAGSAAERSCRLYHSLAFVLLLATLFLGMQANGSHSITQASSDAPNLIREARAAASRGDFSAAAGLYSRAANVSPRDPNLRIQLAAAFAKTGQFTDAIENYQEALKLSPRSSAAEVGLAQAFRGVHNFEEARRILVRAVREHPRDATPLATLGDIELELQTYDASIKHFTAALALKPADNDTRDRLASAYKSKGDSAGALAQLSKVLARDPKNALAYYLRAEIEADRNEDDAALRDAEKVLELQPQNRPGRILLGKILIRTPPGAAAAEIAERCRRAAETLDPVAVEHKDSQTLFVLSRAYHCAGQADKEQETLTAFEKASQSDRDAAEGEKQARHLVQEANDRAMKNDFTGALDLLQRALETNPKSGAAYSQLAKLYYSGGDIDHASEAIGKALALDPYHPDFLYVEGKIFERQRKLDDALAAFQQTALVNPQESDAYFEMGVIYEQLHDQPRAVAAYKKAVALSPDDPDYRRALASLVGSTAPNKP